MPLKLIGQDHVLPQILPYITMWRAGLSLERGPVGNFLLLGPTGTGKTHTIEYLAEHLHSDPTSYIRVDCAEYAMEHEIAKLIGSPPGYLGHKETKPALTNERILHNTSPTCKLALILFDEIEKAAPSLHQLMLGIMDKGTLRLGDGNSVKFRDVMIFFTSNLGADKMLSYLSPNVGFVPSTYDKTINPKKLEEIGLAAAKKTFRPEFMNRIDKTITFHPLERSALIGIVGEEIDVVLEQIAGVTEDCQVFVGVEVIDWLVKHGTSPAYGAREIKRLIMNNITQPIAQIIVDKKIDGNTDIYVECKEDKILVSARERQTMLVKGTASA